MKHQSSDLACESQTSFLFLQNILFRALFSVTKREFLKLRLISVRSSHHLTTRSNHHSRFFQRVVPAAPLEPNDSQFGCNVIGIMEIQSVQASPTRSPPPAALHRKMIVTFYNCVNYQFSARINKVHLEHAGAIQRASVIISVVRGERTVV
jgi:hypothetical protein